MEIWCGDHILKGTFIKIRNSITLCNKNDSGHKGAAIWRETEDTKITIAELQESQRGHDWDLQVYTWHQYGKNKLLTIVWRKAYLGTYSNLKESGEQHKQKENIVEEWSSCYRRWWMLLH